MTDALNHDTLYGYDANNRKISETTTRTTPGGMETLATQWEYL